MPAPCKDCTSNLQNKRKSFARGIILMKHTAFKQSGFHVTQGSFKLSFGKLCFVKAWVPMNHGFVPQEAHLWVRGCRAPLLPGWPSIRQRKRPLLLPVLLLDPGTRTGQQNQAAYWKCSREWKDVLTSPSISPLVGRTHRTNVKHEI